MSKPLIEIRKASPGAPKLTRIGRPTSPTRDVTAPVSEKSLDWLRAHSTQSQRQAVADLVEIAIEHIELQRICVTLREEGG